MSNGAPLPRWLAASLLIAIAIVFSANHIAARLAFDHGVSVATAVLTRSAGTALFVFLLLRMTGVPINRPDAGYGRVLLIGLLLSVQSFCLYSAVSRIPVALALLTFNTFPMLLGVLSWSAGGEKPAPRTWLAMVIALLGLALAIDAPGAVMASFAQSAPPDPGSGLTVWVRMASGLAYALGAAISFAAVLFLTTRWLGSMDGRLRSAMTMAVVAVVTGLIAWPMGELALPRDVPAWIGLALLTVLYGSAITALFVVLPRAGAVNNATVMNVEPVSALILAWFILGQRIAPIQIAGMALVIGAIVLLTARGGAASGRAEAVRR